MIFFFREFRNGFSEILGYNNCRCLPLFSKNKIRTSISKSNYSMNTRLTPPIQSRQTSLSPYSNTPQRNGCISHEIPSTPLEKTCRRLTKNDSTDTFEMQMFTQQRRTLEAFDELEHLVPNGLSEPVSLVKMSSIIQDQDDITNELPKQKRFKFFSKSNHS